MAYISQFKSYSTSADGFSYLCAFMISAGWTLHDDVSSTQKIYTSQGEDGVYAPGYISLELSSNTLTIIAYTYWNASTNTGSASAYSYNGQLNFAVTNTLHMYGDKNIIFILVEKSVSGNSLLFGFVPKLFDSTITTTTSGITSGSNVEVPVLSTTGFVKGRSYQFIGNNYEGRDWVTLNAVSSGTNTITVVSLPRNYASGAYVGVCPQPFFGSSTSALDNLYSTSYRTVVGTSDCTSSQIYQVTGALPYNNIDPDNRTSRYILSPIIFTEYYNDGIIGYTTENIFYGYFGSANGDLFGVTNYTAQGPEFGTASSGISTTLTDDSKSWSTNYWTNKVLVLADGIGVGQSRVIASNTANTLTLNTAWYTIPDATTLYYIVDEVYRRVHSVYTIKEVI